MLAGKCVAETDAEAVAEATELPTPAVTKQLSAFVIPPEYNLYSGEDDFNIVYQVALIGALSRMQGQNRVAADGMRGSLGLARCAMGIFGGGTSKYCVQRRASRWTIKRKKASGIC